MQTGLEGEVLSKEEQDALDKLKAYCAKNDIRGFDSHYLLRFVRARKADYPKVELMWANFIKWRKQAAVDSIEKFMPKNLELIRKNYPHGYHKTDRQGRPVYIERVGKFNISQLFKITNEEEMTKYYTKSYELLINRIFPACSKAAGKRISKTVTILDLKDVSLSMVSKQVYNFIQIASKLGQDNYPEILGVMFIINAPFLFSGIWAVCKGWLDKKTQDKIKIIGSSYKKEVLECIDPKNLPNFIDGGQSKQPLELNIGPWNPKGEVEIFDLKMKEEPEVPVHQKKVEEPAVPGHHKAEEVVVPSHIPDVPGHQKTEVVVVPSHSPGIPDVPGHHKAEEAVVPSHSPSIPDVPGHEIEQTANLLASAKVSQ